MSKVKLPLPIGENMIIVAESPGEGEREIYMIKNRHTQVAEAGTSVFAEAVHQAVELDRSTDKALTRVDNYNGSEGAIESEDGNGGLVLQ